MAKILKAGPRTLLVAASLIMKGGIVAYPTDTVYGLGCDPFNGEALLRLVRTKKRKQGRLPVLVDSVGRAEEFGKFEVTAYRLAKRFWPGPLTLVVPSRIRLPDIVTGSTGYVGLRNPRHPVAIQLIRACAGAIVGTSANVSGETPAETAHQAAKELDGKLDLVLDGGRTGSGVESSVVEIDDGSVSILRERSVTRERIFHALRTYGREFT